MWNPTFLHYNKKILIVWKTLQGLSEYLCMIAEVNFEFSELKSV